MYKLMFGALAAATIGAAVFLGELITPLQAFGGAVMIAALVAFQLRK